MNRLLDKMDESNGFNKSMKLYIATPSSRAVRRWCRRRRAGRSILVGGEEIGGGAALAAKRIFAKIFEKILFYPQHFLMTVLGIENCDKITTQQQLHRRRVDKLSAAALRSTKVGGGTHKLSAAARPAHSSTFKIPTERRSAWCR